MVEYVTWKNISLIQKVNGKFWGVFLVDIIWKEVTVIFNQRLGMNIIFHYVLHGFCTGRGMETTSIEAKLLQ